MNQIKTLLSEYYQTRTARNECEYIRRWSLTEIAKLLGMDLDAVGASEVIATAEIAAARDLLRGEPNEALLAALKVVYANGAELEARVNAEEAAVKRLREALLALPGSPGRTALREDADCEAYAAHVICREHVADQTAR
jgi:hypothetical protein